MTDKNLRDQQEKAALRYKATIASKASRRVEARTQKDNSLFVGIGAFGVIGWSVAVPTLLGVATGVWLDKHYPGPYSWTLMLLFLGVMLGCFNAWLWIHQAGSR